MSTTRPLVHVSAGKGRKAVHFYIPEATCLDKLKVFVEMCDPDWMAIGGNTEASVDLYYYRPEPNGSSIVTYEDYV